MVQCDEERVRGWQELEFHDIALYLEAIAEEFSLLFMKLQNKKSEQKVLMKEALSSPEILGAAPTWDVSRIHAGCISRGSLKVKTKERLHGSHW